MGRNLGGGLAPSDHAREGLGEYAGLVAGYHGHARRDRWGARPDHWRDQTISLPCQGNYVAGSIATVAKRLSQRSDMESEAWFFDRETGPDPGCQILLPDDLARMVDQCEQYIQRTCAQLNRLVAPIKEPLCRRQSERTK
jgi:hypothetical protein